MTTTQQATEIAVGDRIYAIENIRYDAHRVIDIPRGSEGTIIDVTDDDGWPLMVEWDAGIIGAVSSESVALVPVAFDLEAWFALRGVERDSNAMADLLDLYASKTEAEMDEIYDAMHGSIA